MKKIVPGALFVFTIIAFASAQSKFVCTDFQTNLVRGSESKNVLALQNFLVAKGLLKATPNGYFGPATLAAVKAYQKSVRLSQVGNTGPATRAAIKKESCSAPNMANQNTNTPSVPVVSPTAPIATTTASAPPQQNIPRPILSSLDMVTLFAEGETDWGFNMYGRDFSTSTNTVYFRNTNNRRTYTIGTFASATGTMLVLPKNLTGIVYSCGTGCQEKLPAGRYEVTVATAGGESEPKMIDARAFTISSQTGAAQGALPAKATNNKFGTVSFSSSQPAVLRSITLQTSSSTISSTGLGAFIFKDEMTGSTALQNKELSAFQSMIISAYTNTDNKIPGTLIANFVVEIEDYIGKKRTKFVSPPFLVTVAGVL